MLADCCNFVSCARSGMQRMHALYALPRGYNNILRTHIGTCSVFAI